MKQMDEGTYIVDPRELDHEPVMGKPKKTTHFVPQKHLEFPGTDGTSYLPRWRLG